MKKILFVMAVAVMTACNVSQMKYDAGGRNACQYVKEKMYLSDEDIQRIEVTKEDSLLSDSWLSWDRAKFSQAGVDFLEDKISTDEYREIVEERSELLNDVMNSWSIVGMVVNDSLRRLQKYNDVWRKVYTVSITMKSGTMRETRVIMDRDGITPRMTENEFAHTIKKYERDVMEGYSDLRKYGKK